ncbi:MAG TPA: TonB-dependent receptor [Vicinamibacterales bacterium]|nr:TonB-dependent receptor [Vicinamibacterales bacterium]
MIVTLALSNSTLRRRMQRAALAVVASAGLLCSPFAAAADAQVLYGSVVGNVTDGQGAQVPAASVTITNNATNFSAETVTNSEGGYSVPNVLPGSYDVKVSLQGFREFVKTGVPVSAGQISRVDVKLDIGAMTEVVTVESAVQLLQTDKTDLHTELKSKEIINLPLNQYRNYQTLINLVPGATPATFQNAQTDTPGRSLRTFVNGSNPNSNNTRIDGASSVNIWLPHHVGYVAPAETIETVNISTNNFGADQGMAGGAAITLITKSGTNNLRGSAFYFRNQDELNARPFFDPSKLDSSIVIGGGTVGGPVRRDRVFYFASWEGNYEKNSRFDRYSVPTAKMRNGDFSEVLGIFPNFRLFDPATGNPDGTGRTEFVGGVIPADRINSIARAIQALYPAPNDPGTNNGLQRNLVLARAPVANRDNYDLKVNWNRNSAHQMFAKFSTMQADVENLFKLGIDGGGIGDTKVYVATVGHTWTLGSKTVLDGSAGLNRQDQVARGSDFGSNFGSETFGIPGTNGPDPRQGGMPSFNPGLSTLGNNDSWHPLERHEKGYTVTTNLTRVAGAHEFRTGFDFIRYQLNHYQPELGAGPRGDFGFSGNITGMPGYTANAWNSYAAFLLGRTSGFGKSIQFEEMTGRENQYGLYVSDRWNASEKLTLNLGLRYEYYPLMQRENRGIERLDYSTFDVLLGGVGNIPKDVGINVNKGLLAPRLGAAYRINEKTVFRTGYGVTYNPIPWSRPLRGFYPLTIGFTQSAPNFQSFPLAEGIPTIPLPDVSTGRVRLPRNTLMRTPSADDVDRGRTQQWNVTVERQFPLDVGISLAYVGTRTDGGYADQNVNYSESGGDAGRQYFAQAGTASILEWAARTKSRYKGLQMAINRPFKGGLLLKGAYTLSKAMNETDEDGWATLLWSQPSQLSRNFALTGYDRTHVFQMGFLYELPVGKNSNSPLGILIKDWQINGIFSAFSGTPFTIAGDNTALNQRGGQQTIEQVAAIRRVGDAGPNEVYYDPASFAQPGNKWGNTGRNFLRGPSQWNLDLGLFRGVPIGRYRVEFRAQATNVLNHTRWGNPNTSFTDPNFMKILSVGDPRRVQLGLRFQF